MASRYQEVYQSWRNDPQAFWAEAAKAVDWIKPPTVAFDPKAGRLWPLVSRRHAQHLLQRHRPACEERPRPAGGDHL